MQTETQTPRHGGAPVRQCALTRERLPADALIRFCLSPEARVVPDLKNRLPGRGVWIRAERDCIARASKSGIFSRAFSQAVGPEPDLAGTVDALLERAALSRLSIANKAGLIAAGFDNVIQAISRGRVAVLLHASDGAPGGREKIVRKAKDLQFSTFDCFNSARLSLALGRLNVIHAAVNRGGACEKFVQDADRLQRYRSSGAANTAARETVMEPE